MRAKVDREAQPRSPRSKGRTPAGAAVALNQAIGNRAFASLARDVPSLDPRTQLEKNPERWGQAKPKAKPERAGRSDVTSWDSLPSALKEVLERSWGDAGAFSIYRALSDEARSFLVAWYNRMIGYELWGHVRTVKVIKPGEKPAKLGPIQLHVQGLSQSVVFEVYDGRALRDDMLRSERFGKDVGAQGLLHLGQTSMREWATQTTDGLHLSIGAGNEADAHIDKKSPTNKPQMGESQMDWIRSWEHHWQEVWPEFIRQGPGFLAKVPRYIYEWLVDKTKKLGVGKRFRDALKAIPRSFFNIIAELAGIPDAAYAGTTIKPGESFEDPHTRPRGSWIVILKEYRFGSKGRPAGKPVEVPAAQSPLPENVAIAVERAITTALPGSVRPTGQVRLESETESLIAKPDEFAKNEYVAEGLARLMLFRAKGGGGQVGIDLGLVYEFLSQAQVEEVKKQLAAIGKIVRDALGEELAKTDEDLAAKVLLVRSAVTPARRGPAPLPAALVSSSKHPRPARRPLRDALRPRGTRGRPDPPRRRERPGARRGSRRAAGRRRAHRRA